MQRTLTNVRVAAISCTAMCVRVAAITGKAIYARVAVNARNVDECQGYGNWGDSDIC